MQWRTEANGSVIGECEGGNHLLVSLRSVQKGGKHRDLGPGRQKRGAGLERKELARGFDPAFGKNAKDPPVVQSAEGGPGGGGIPAAAIDGNRIDGVEDHAHRPKVVVFPRHHPDDHSLADGLNQEGIEAAGVIADENAGPFARQALGREHIQLMVNP